MAATLVATSIAVPASATNRDHSIDAPPVPEVIATGLDNPRQLTVTDSGDIFVAESGTGGAGPCLPNPEDPTAEVCFGLSGAITRISDWGQRRVVTGLPSMAGSDGSSATGPSDVATGRGNKLAIVIGLGADPAVRTAHPQLAMLGTIVTTRWRHDSPKVVADVAAFEAANDPVPDPESNLPDSNPVSILRQGRSYVVADAGGNTIVRARKHGDVSLIGKLPSQMATAPPFLGLPPGAQIPAQAVPTSVAVGPDGAFYVSQLTGFPFQAGLAKIWRIGWDGTPTVYAEGLTNVTDLAFADDGTLYAVQISTLGLLNGPMGSLVKVKRGAAPEVVVGDLFAPYGLAISGRSAYLTTGSVAAGAGQVVKVKLPRSGGHWHRDGKR